jgi:hypothetical protein
MSMAAHCGKVAVTRNAGCIYAFELPKAWCMPVAYGPGHLISTDSPVSTNMHMLLAQTIISTPTKNYTVLEQKQLMLDMGDVGGVSNWQVHQTVCICLWKVSVV